MTNTFISYFNSANKQIFYTELKIKHLKTLYKCLLEDPPNPKTTIFNINQILFELTNLNEKEINKFNFVDYFLFLLELRCSSISNTIFAEFTDQKNTKIEINLNSFINQIKLIDYTTLLKKDIFNNIVIQYKLPSINETLFLNENKQLEIDCFYKHFISQIIIEEKKITLSDYNNDEIQNILNKLPAKLTSTIIKKVLNILKEVSVNLFSEINGLKEKQLIFNFNIINLIYIIKFVFGEQLMSLYDNIFALCKVGNFTPEYIENCSPGEYIIFVKKLEDLTSKQQKQAQNSFIDPNGFEDSFF